MVLTSWTQTIFFLALLVGLARPTYSADVECTWDACPVCLADAKPEGVNISITGQDKILYTTPFRLARANFGWDSQSMLHTVLGILFREKLGINVAYTDVTDEYQSMLAMLNCAGYLGATCDEQPRTAEAASRLVANGTKRFADPLPDIFASVEIWPGATNIDELGITAEQFDEGGVLSLGSAGFLVKEWLWVTPEAVRSAWAAKFVLTNYLTWSMEAVTDYVSTPRTYRDAGVRAEIPGCPGDPHLPAVLLNGFELLESFGYVCRDSWWLTPACDALGEAWWDKCAGVIDDDWGYVKPDMYKAMSHLSMRVAKMTVGYTEFTNVCLNRTFNSSFLWWDSDTALTSLRPRGVQLEKDLDTQSLIIEKQAWSKALKYSTKINTIFKGVSLSNLHLNSMLQLVAEAVDQGYFASEDIQPGFWQKLACEWIWAHEDVWSSWLPDPRSCNSGETFDNQTQDCKPCLVGTHLVSDANGLRCSPCEPGTVQESTGMEVCTPCEAGTFQPDAGMSSCLRCQRSSYANETGSSACTACPAGKTTDGTGFSNSDLCLCPPGSFESTVVGDCIPCGEGATCKGFGTSPEALPGFHLAAVSAHGLRTFICDKTEFCPGGLVGTCAEGRTDLGCSKCVSGMSPRGGGTCGPCRGNDFLPLFLLAIGVLVVLVGTYHHSTSENKSRQSAALEFTAVGLTQIVGALQAISVVTRVSMDFPQPLAGFFAVFRIVSFDIQDVVEVGCIATFSPATVYAFKTMVLPITCAVLCIVHVIYCLIRKRQMCQRTGPLISAIGIIVQALYISICALVLLPLQCKRQPCGEWTLLRDTATLCWHGGNHTQMIMIGVIALQMPVAFLTYVAWLLWSLPKRVGAGDVEFLNTFAFLFNKVSISKRWFLLFVLVRNLCVAMVPVIPSPFWQTASLSACMFVSACIVCRKLPWKAELANMIDLVVTAGVAALVHVTVAFLDGTNIRGIPEVGIAVVACIVLSGLVPFVFALLQALRRKGKPFDFFLCHQKAGAGALARLLKLALVEHRSGCKVFIDSDNLRDLSTLFLVVRRDVRTLVVLCSRELLQSQWCLGEITTATLCNIGVISLYLPDFVVPTNDFINSITAGSVLSEYAISSVEVQNAVRQFTQVTVVLLPAVINEISLQVVVTGILSFNAPSHSPQKQTSLQGTTSPQKQLSLQGTTSSKKQGPVQGTMRQTTTNPPDTRMHVVFADSSDSEAVASALIYLKLSKRLVVEDALPKQHLPWLFCYEDLDWKNEPTIHSNAVLILVCSAGCFGNTSFLLGVAYLVSCRISRAVAVVSHENFMYPAPSFYNALEERMKQICNEAGFNECPKVLSPFVQALFKRISFRLSVKGSHDIIRFEVQRIWATTSEAPFTDDFGDAVFELISTIRTKQHLVAASTADPAVDDELQDQVGVSTADPAVDDDATAEASDGFTL